MEVPLFAADPVEMGLNDANKGRVAAAPAADRWYAKRFPRVFPKAKRPLNWATVSARSPPSSAASSRPARATTASGGVRRS